MYHFEEFQLTDEEKGLSIVFDDINFQILSTFLFCDVKPFSEWIKKVFDKVLSGESEYEEVNGNVCSVEITKDKTKIYDKLSENEVENWCEIGTQELRSLINIWCTAVDEFKKIIKKRCYSDCKNTIHLFFKYNKYYVITL